MLCDFAGSVSSAACPGQGPGTAGTLQHRRGRSACSFLRGQLGSARVGGREGCEWVPCSWQGCMFMPFSPAHRAPLWDSTALGGCGLSALVASAAWASLSSHVVRCHRDPEGRGNWRRAAELFLGPADTWLWCLQDLCFAYWHCRGKEMYSVLEILCGLGPFTKDLSQISRRAEAKVEVSEGD